MDRRYINIYLLLYYYYYYYYDSPSSQLIRLQNEAVRIMNDVPLQVSITPHYVNLGLLKFRDIVKL